MNLTAKEARQSSRRRALRASDATGSQSKFSLPYAALALSPGRASRPKTDRPAPRNQLLGGQYRQSKSSVLDRTRHAVDSRCAPPSRSSPHAGVGLPDNQHTATGNSAPSRPEALQYGGPSKIVAGRTARATNQSLGGSPPRTTHTAPQRVTPRFEENRKSRNTCQMFGITVRFRADATLSTKVPREFEAELVAPLRE
jgi:hypothetical protein